MNLQEEVEIACPYCGAPFVTFVDKSAGSFNAVEDCQVCCRPIELIVRCDAGEITSIDARRA